MLLIVLQTAAALAAILLVWAAARPDRFRIERSARMPASPEKVFSLISDFHQWPQWSPWEKKDTAMRKTHSGAPSGRGAVYEWEGNSKVGKGRMEITDTVAAQRVVIRLDFFKPFEAHNTAEFSIAADGEGSRVSWAMQGPQPFMARLMGIFFNMDKVVGGDFEAGLANLAAAAGK